jgi:hypothetical protein
VLVVALESERAWDPALLARVAALSETLAKCTACAASTVSPPCP